MNQATTAMKLERRFLRWLKAQRREIEALCPARAIPRHHAHWHARNRHCFRVIDRLMWLEFLEHPLGGRPETAATGPDEAQPIATLRLAWGLTRLDQLKGGKDPGSLRLLRKILALRDDLRRHRFPSWEDHAAASLRLLRLCEALCRAGFASRTAGERGEHEPSGLGGDGLCTTG